MREEKVRPMGRTDGPRRLPPAICCSAPRLGAAATLGLTLLAGTVAPPTAAAPSLLRQLGGTDGNVSAAVKYGNTLYVGGYFERAGPVTGSCVAADAVTGNLVGRFPEVRGDVDAVASDGAGGWFLGGTFSAIDGTAHGGLARVDSSLRLVSWDPAPDGAVLALATSGDTLFVGGTFQRVGGIARPHLAAFRISGGELLDTLPAPDGPVRALLVEHGRLYVAGDSPDPVNGTLGAVFAYDLSRWDVSVWQERGEGPGVYGFVRSLASCGELLFLGGSFGANGRPGVMNVGAIDTRTGVLDAWNPQVTGPNDSYYGVVSVDALAVRDSSVYAGGHFAWVNGVRRGGLAKIGYPSGIVAAWNPDPGPWFAGDFNRDVSAMLLRGRTLYLAGQFEAIKDSSRAYLAAVDAATGAVMPWQPGASPFASALAEHENTTVVAGRFEGTGAEWRERRFGLAAFDLTTGRLKPWNPRLSGLGVERMAAGAARIYVGGHFDSLGGRPRYCLGAVDTLNGDATDWDPGCNGPVTTLRAHRDTLYVGGGFTSLAGQPRSYIGAFETTTGALTAWAPIVSDVVCAIEPAGSRIFFGGNFVHIT